MDELSFSQGNPNLLPRITASDAPFRELPIDPTLVDMHGARLLPARDSLPAHGGEEKCRAVGYMSNGSGLSSPARLCEESGSGEWRRIYDRVEALLPQPQVEKLAANRARLEETNKTQQKLWDAREDSLQAFLLQAEASRRRWKEAYIQLPLLANPKIIELHENDLKDYRTCEDADNSQLEEARTGVELRQNNEDHGGIDRELRAELRKLKNAYEAVCSNKDTEISALVGVKDFLWNQLRTIDKENMALLKIKEVEAAQATEAAHKLQHNIEEMQVAAQKLQQNIEDMQVSAQHKDKEIARS